MSTATNPNTPPRDSLVSTTTNGQAPVKKNDDGQAVSPGATSLSAARVYLDRGWAPIPIPHGAKAPCLREWTSLRVSADDLPHFFANDCNVGLLLGAASGGLVDVDLDVPEAVAAAELLLPKTGMVHGRADKPRSHHWYITASPPETARWQDMNGDVLCELRSTGSQTLVPPSRHPGGQDYKWHAFDEPARVDGPTLRLHCALIASCAFLARRWPAQPSNRHQLALPLAGFLLQGGLDEQRASLIVQTVARIARDEEVKDRVGAVRDTARRLARGEHVTGELALAGLLGQPAVQRPREMLQLRDNRSVLDAPRVQWELRSFQDAMQGASDRPPWVIEDLVLEQSGTLVSAHPHSMKSLAWLAGCLEGVAKRKVWGHFAAPDLDSALFVETEDPPWLVEGRIRGLAKGLGLDEKEPLPGFHYTCVGPFDLLQEESNIRGLIDDHGLKLIVVSTLQNLLSGRSWKQQDDMQPILAMLVGISRHCPTVVLTHSPWDRKQKRPAGSVTIAANFVTSLHFEKVIKKDPNYVHVSVDSKVGAQETDFTLRLSTDGDPRDPSSVRAWTTSAPDGQKVSRRTRCWLRWRTIPTPRPRRSRSALACPAAMWRSS